MLFDAEAFEACLNQAFTLSDGDYRDELELIRVDRLSGAQTTTAREAFSAIFQSRSDVLLEQRIYNLNNAGMGDMQIFLVPIGQDENGVRYEAVFS